MDKPEKILIARTDRIGDVVLSTPVIRYFRKEYPDAYLAFMVRPYTVDIVKNNPHLDEVIVYDKDYEHKSVLRTLLFGLSLRKKRFDLAIALHPTNRVHAVFFIAGIPVRIGYDRNMGMLLTKKIRHSKQEGLKHEASYNFDLCKNAGFHVKDPDLCPYIVTDKHEKTLVDKLIADQRIKPGFIAVHAGASCPSKRWPPGRFTEVCKKIIDSTGHDVVLVGGSETADISGKIASGVSHNCFDLTDMLLVGELAELLSRAELLISNDSGPVHVSAAVGTPVISIFGRKDPGLSPARWAPLGDNHIVLHKDAGCVDCLAHNCDKGFKCLDSVSTEEVVEAALKLLKK